MTKKELESIVNGMIAAFVVVVNTDATQKEAFAAIDRIRKYGAMMGELIE